VGEKAVLFVERAFRLDGTIVSQNLGRDGVRYGFRPEDQTHVAHVLGHELCTVTMDGTLIPLADPPKERPQAKEKKKGGCVVQ
jgi:hypothetical protein